MFLTLLSPQGTLPPDPPDPPAVIGGGGFASYIRPRRHHGTGEMIQSPQVLSGRARLIPYALTVRGRNARLLALLE